MASSYRTGAYNFHSYCYEEPISNDEPVVRQRNGKYGKKGSSIREDFSVEIFRRKNK